MAKKIAVVLTGCGYQDGTEITEAVSTLIALGQTGAQFSCFSPSTDFDATNHLDGSPENQRNTLAESARICRGKVETLDTLDPHQFDGIVFPGGFGVARWLCDWADKGASCSVHPLVQKLILNFHGDSKPIGALCIAPALIARVLGSEDVTVTIGNDSATAAEIEKTGALHESCAVDDFITDRENKVITTPAYMYDDAAPAEVFLGVSRMIKELVEMA